MEKNQQILLGAAVLTIGGYLLWKSKQPKKATFMRMSGGKKPMVGLNGVKGLDVSGKLVNRRRMVGLNGVKGLDVSGKLVNRKRMVGMINNDKVQEGPFKNLINSTNVEECSFKTFTPENLGSDLLSVKNSNFFDQNILESKFS